MIPLGPVVARARMQAPRAAVWAYLVDADHRAGWWSEVRIDPRLGGQIAEQWAEDGDAPGRDVTGEIDVLVEGHAIGFRWREAGDERDTSVLLTLRSHGSETGVTVTESGFDALPAAADRAAAALGDWEELLTGYATAVETAVAGGFVAEESAAGSAPEEPEESAEPEAPAEPKGEGAEAADAVDAASPLQGSDEPDPSEAPDARAAEGVDAEEVAEPIEPEESPDLDDTVALDRIEVTPEEPGDESPGIAVEAPVDAEPESEGAVPAQDAAEPEREAEPDEKLAAPASEDPGTVPLVLPGPPAGYTPDAPQVASAEVDEAFESTGDPDFDALLRGE